MCESVSANALLVATLRNTAFAEISPKNRDSINALSKNKLGAIFISATRRQISLTIKNDPKGGSAQTYPVGALRVVATLARDVFVRIPWEDAEVNIQAKGRGQFPHENCAV